MTRSLLLRQLIPGLAAPSIAPRVFHSYVPGALPYKLRAVDLASSRIVVWSHGKGDYLEDFLTSFLWQAFPTVKDVIWSHSEADLLAIDALPLGIMSHFVYVEDAPFPSLIPAIAWSAEPFRVHTDLLPKPDISIVSSFIGLTRSDIFLPQLFLRKLPADTPRSLRLTEDDVTLRPYAVGYINSNCIEYRETLFRKLLERLGPDQARARGKCSTNDAPVPGRWLDSSLLDSYRDFKVVFALENGDHAGYVTEKILNAFLSGAIPIHSGASSYVKSGTCQ